MRELLSFADHPLARIIAIALLQFVWQGALVWLVAAMGLRALRRSSAPARYLLAIVCLAVMCGLPAATVVRIVVVNPAISVGPLASSLASTDSPGTIAQRSGSASLAPSAARPAMFATELLDELRARVRPWLPTVFAAWLLSVTVLLVRLCGGWWRARRIVSRAASVSDAQWGSRVARMAHELGVFAPVRLLQSAAVSVPVVIGWLRPAVVVPVSALAGLTPADLEAILAHELAHIRRADYLVNLLQNLAETLFFYHPAVWWVSRQVRLEREHCCDDIAAVTCGDAMKYAEALAALEALRPRTPALAVGAAGGDLLARIRRLVEPEVDRSSVGSGGLMVGAVVVFVGLLVNVTAQSPAPLPSVARPSVEAIAPAPAEPSPTPESRAPEAPAPPAVGGIKGEVRDEDGGTIPGVTVSVRTTSGAAIGSVVTDARGRFAFPSLPADVYEITVSLYGFRTWRARLSVADGEATPAGVQLRLGAMSEVVNVIAPASMVATAPVSAVIPTAQNRTTASAAVDAVRALMPEQTGPIRVGGAIKEPKRVNYVAPEYSPDAIARGLTGQVIIEAVIDTTGAVTDAKILIGQPLLNKAVLAAVAQWRYTPVLLNGVPRAVTLTVAVNFSAR